MAEVVDSIVAELIAKTSSYEAGFDRAIAKHKEFTRSLPKLDGVEIAKGAQAYADRHRKAAGDVVKVETDTTEKVTRTRKARVASAVAADEAEVKSAKAASAAKIAAAEKEAAARRQIELRETRARLQREALAPQREFGGDLASDAAHAAYMAKRDAALAKGGAFNSAYTGLPQKPAAASAAAPVAAEAEINHLLADRFDLQQRIRYATGEQKVALQTELETLRRIDTYERAGLSTAEANLRVDREMAAIEAERAVIARRQASGGVKRGAEQFARGAGAYAAVGGGAAIAGLAVVTAVAVGVEAIESAIQYGKALKTVSDQLGITVTDLQAYQKMARDAGVSTEQLTSAFGQFSANLGHAQEGSQEQAKNFKALGLSVKDFKTAGDALPAVIDRISQIPDQAKRAGIETRLFGEEGRRLDPLLSGGAKAVSDLARSLQETGHALSAKEIQDLDRTAQKLAAVKAELAVDQARLVSGNADAIIGLANSYNILASSIVNTIGKLQQYGATLARTSFLATADTAQVGRQFQMQTHTGRLQLYKENEAQLADVRAGNGNFDLRAARTPAEARALMLKLRHAREVQLVAEHNEIVRADKADPIVPTPPVPPGTYNPKLLNSLGAPKPPKGKSAEALAKEAAAREKRFQDELARSQDEYLTAEREITIGSEARLTIDKARLATDHERRLADIDAEAKEKQIDANKVKVLKAAEDLAYSEKLRVLASQKAVELEGQINDLRQQAYQAQIAHLSSEEGLARTSAERAVKARERLSKQREAETAGFNATINSADPSVSDSARAQARAGLAGLDQKYADAQRESDHQNLGPLGAYLDKLPKTAAEVREAFEGALVNSIEKVNDSLATTLENLTGIHGIAGELLTDFIKIGIQILENAAAGKGGGDFFSSIASAASTVFGGPRAAGGDVRAGRTYLVGEKGPELFTPGASGGITPNHMINVAASNRQAAQRGGGDTIVQQTFVLDARYGITTPQLLQHVNDVASQKAAQAGQISYHSAVAATPGTLQRQDTLGN